MYLYKSGHHLENRRYRTYINSLLLGCGCVNLSTYPHMNKGQLHYWTKGKQRISTELLIRMLSDNRWRSQSMQASAKIRWKRRRRRRSIEGGGGKAGRGGERGGEKEEYIDSYNSGKTEVENSKASKRQGRGRYQATILNQFLSITMPFSSEPLWKNRQGWGL